MPAGTSSLHIIGLLPLIPVDTVSTVHLHYTKSLSLTLSGHNNVHLQSLRSLRERALTFTEFIFLTVDPVD